MGPLRKRQRNMTLYGVKGCARLWRKFTPIRLCGRGCEGGTFEFYRNGELLDWKGDNLHLNLLKPSGNFTYHQV
jgi:hypothetical protein